MISRIDKIAVELPKPKSASPNDAAALQELLGGKFGEMSTLMNYTFQSFNFRGREAYRPFYDTIASIAAEEYSHIETLSYAINMLLTGASPRGNDPTVAPLKEATNWRNTYHAVATGQQAYCGDSMGNFWTGQNVFSSGNLKLDLLHNFFLECGARANKIRVYEMTKDPCARAAVGYLLVRGGLHVVAYAKALEKLSGVAVGGLLPIPDISNKRFPEARKHEENGQHLVLYTYSANDYKRVSEVWQGPHPDDGQPLRVEQGPPKGFTPPNLEAEPQLTSPDGPDAGPDPEMLKEYADKIFGTSMKVSMTTASPGAAKAKKSKSAK